MENLNFYYLNYNNRYNILDNESSKCISNYILNLQYDMNLEEIEMKSYDNIQKEFGQILDVGKMKKFLAKIFCSNVIKDAFKFLYPEYFNFPFKDENDCLNFLDKYYHFIPFKSVKTTAVTDKFSLEIFYFLKLKRIYISRKFSKELNKLINNILYRGSCTKTSCHEINHEFYNLLLMHSNGSISLETPRKIFIDDREGGKNIERLLFNRPISKLSLLECIYLLNERNYEKNLEEFKKGFNELTIKELQFDKNSLFQEFNVVFNIENFEEVGKKSYIRCDENDNSNIYIDTYIDDIEDVNDVLGFIIEPSKM